ncbi:MULTISPECIES: OmpA family protein [unclassified Brevibacterium]|uniref:OmpA/MotB family protein n=1 Tax=unclassified Brevibacterium TaxID=2614124 RepID=UPI0010F4D413|nr:MULTISPECIES: OmpA family protein [unclassified Brevibacterium]MCM1011828.1 OmpA family protein [Brevibacterium sp. XM4083]
MTGVLFVFILVVVVLAIQLMQAQKDFKAQTDDLSEQIENSSKAETIRKDMLDEIRDQLESQGIEVVVAQNGSVISIPNDSLGFDRGSYEIKEQYKDESLAIGKVIATAIEQHNGAKFLDTVFVEGHTDNANYEGLEGTGNWGLSTFRAISLWKLWEDDLPSNEQLAKMQGPDGNPLFSVSGYGETRPMNDDQSTDAGAAANRRIDIRFTIMRADSDQLKEIEREVTER